jgi:lysozyme
MPDPARRTLVLSLPALAIAACTPTPRHTATPQTPAAAPLVHPPRFGDSHPIDFAGQHPKRFAVHGIDAARFQTHADWRAARASGVNFAWLKATEGGDRLDPMFAPHMQEARRAGIPVGAYHFFYFCTPALVQARWFIKNVKKRPGMLPPVLDLEWNPHSPTCTLRPEGRIVRREARLFLDALESHYGQRPVVYTTLEFWRETDIGKLRGVEFWLRSTAEPPRKTYPGQRWRFWQYSSTGIVPGFAEAVDLNLFNGSKADWHAWLAARQVR